MSDEKNEVCFETQHYKASAESFKIYLPSKEVTKTGKTKTFPVFIRRIVLNCKRSGTEIKFPATTRKGVLSFGDSRPTANKLPNRYDIPKMTSELNRLVGNEIAHCLVNIALS